MTRVLVTGVGGPSGRSLARQLLDRGLAVSGVDMADVALPGVRTARVPAAGDPGFLDALRAVATGHGADLIVPTVSEELPVLAAADVGVTVVIARAAAVEVANDKWLTHLLLWDAGVAVPRSCPGGSAAAVFAHCDTTWLSKPRVGRGGRGVRVHRPGARTLLVADDDRIVQEFVPGTEYAVNLYLAARPEDDVVDVLEKTALAHGETGNAVAVRRVAEPDVALLARVAASVVGISGPADVDIRRRADGNPVVLEVNARLGAHSGRTPAVVDALLAEYAAVVG
ncbi:ATP-grasp domain-containing protein [Actinokineospora sp.]|uniref:ATP-grasp domain-containing protein n=1 Tax=Actinokineospora sp. TaxID=1872133 RepID=UPI004037B63C